MPTTSSIGRQVAVACILAFLFGATQAQVLADFGTYPRSTQAVEPLGSDLMGDKIDYATGNLEFSNTDVSLPGNSPLTVSFGRTIGTGQAQHSLILGLFGDWDVDIPHLHSLVSAAVGDWRGIPSEIGRHPSEARCSQFSSPDQIVSATGIDWSPYTWWEGNNLYVPGTGDQVMLARHWGYADTAQPHPINTLQPSDGNNYPILTKNGWQFSCLSTVTGGVGEGFLAHAPDGSLYQFDHIATRAAPYTSNGLARSEVWILPSKIYDRFGNSVVYKYDASDAWKLTNVHGSDGRNIDITYFSGSHRVQSISDGSRTWAYAYASNGSLQKVTLPDSSTWTFSIAPLLHSIFTLPGANSSSGISSAFNPNVYQGTITHPSGAIAVFNTKLIIFGHAVYGHAPYFGKFNTNTYFPWSGAYSIQSKTLSGPGMPTATWTYAYSNPQGCFSTDTRCVAKNTVVTVTDPDGAYLTNTYGTSFGVNEGLLLTSVTGSAAAGILRTTSYQYASPSAGPYPQNIGYDNNVLHEMMSVIYTPIATKTVVQQGVTFSQAATSFDPQARMTGASDTSSLGFSRTEATTFEDNLQLWVIGQVGIRSINGAQLSSNIYLTNALRQAEYKFGKLKNSYSYNSDGTMYQTIDGLGHATTFSNWMRGTPQSISYADGTAISSVVNNIGNISSQRNQTGSVWSFGYDNIGRLSSITYPSGDSVNYSNTIQTFTQSTSAEFGLGANHWRQTIVKGNAVTLNLYDARWRKVFSQTYDSTNQAATLKQKVYQYDEYNNNVFESYPTKSIATVGDTPPGTRRAYDALGRIVSTQSDSELGTLTSTQTYLTNFLTQITDANQNVTTVGYQVFDEPDETFVVSIQKPEGANVSIARDGFGKPVSVTRSGSFAGAALTATRQYVYDSYQLLCKTIEPETGATVQSLDAANNVSWRATGLALSSTSSCDTSSVPAATQASYSYDARNRIINSSFGDGSPSISRAYTADGLPLSVVSNGTNWNYSYNNRRLRTQESFVAGSTYGIQWGYDAYGNISSLTYPDGVTVNYFPDALGQPTKVGNYASGITYWPNGATAQYTFGNGIFHNSTQNTRQLPLLNQDGAVLQDQYGYDANGNISSINDLLQGINSRTMSYDGLNRLRTVDNAGVWGAASYTYDPLDNLRTSIVGSRSSIHSYDANNRLSAIATNNAAVTNYAYDSRGNVTTRGSETLSFDEDNRLSLVSGVASYIYDGLGRRALISQSSTSEVQIYDADGELLYGVTSANGQTQNTKYIYLGGRVIAETNGTTGVTTYLHTDAIGSPVATSNPSGALLTQTRYEPFGKTAAGSDPSDIGFTGHVNDSSTGLIYMQQRYYDPISARFVSIDPIPPDPNSGDAFNIYAYAQENPYRYIDGDGRKDDDVVATFTRDVTGSHIPQKVTVKSDGSVQVSGPNTAGMSTSSSNQSSIAGGAPDSGIAPATNGRGPNERGSAAATEVAAQLQAQGFLILAFEVPAFMPPLVQGRRYDIVAARNGTLYGVEVKSTIVGSFRLDPSQVFFDSIVVSRGVPTSVGVITGVMYRGACFGCGPSAVWRSAVQLGVLKAAGIPSTITNLPAWLTK
jgi:RHS repeat-associated protein